MSKLKETKMGKLLSSPSIVKNRYIILLFLALLAISIVSLRINNLHMIDLRNQVLKADQQNKNIDEKINDLERFVKTHMNTGLGQPLELVYSYERAAQVAREQASDTGVDTTIYKKAQEQCERQEIPLTIRAQCVQEYVSANTPEGQEPPSVKLPEKDDFTFDFKPPLWSFDVAGISIFMTLYCLIVLAARMIADYLAAAHLRSKGLDNLIDSKNIK